MPTEQTSSRGKRTVVALLVGCLIAALMVGGCARSGDGVELGPDFAEPVALSSRDGVLEVGLTAVQGSTKLNTVAEPVKGMLLFSWQLIKGETDGPTSGIGQYPGPTLKVNPGDALIVHVGNGMSDITIPDFVDPTLTPKGEVVPKTPDLAKNLPLNLHTHGLHVSPNLNSDNILLEFDPDTSNTYKYDIPKDHPQGTYWYHPHRHQLTEQQVYRGLTGMLIVGRPEGAIPKVAANNVPVRLMALQGNLVSSRAAGMNEMNYTSWTQMINTEAIPEKGSVEQGTYEPIAAPVNFPVSPAGTTFKTNWFAGPLTADNKRGAFQFMPQNLIDFQSNDKATSSPADTSYPDHLRDFQLTVNGQFQPQLQMAPGQTEVWVIGNYGSQAYMNVAVRNTSTNELVPIRVLATDGNSVPEVVAGNTGAGNSYLLPSASRVAIAVTMPATGGLQLELPPVEGPTAQHTQPLSTEGVLYTSNGDGSIPKGALGTVSIDPQNVNWFDGFKSTPTQVLARVEPAGSPGKTVDFELGEELKGDTEFKNLAAQKVDLVRDFTIGGGSSPWVNPSDPNGFMYMFQDTTWPTTPVIHPRLNSVEEWRFNNTNNDQHPIHIHVNDFEPQKTVDPVQGQKTGPQRVSLDNFNVPAPTLGADEVVLAKGEMSLRSTFKDYIGTFVTHCHRLDHEDNGLMMTINVIPEISTFATVEQGRGGAPAQVTVRDQANGKVVAKVTPFPGTKTVPTAAMADIDGDAVLDLVVGQGQGAGPEVVVYAGAGPNPFAEQITRFDAFESGFTGGVSVAAGPISGDPTKNNLIVSSGPGRPTEVKVFTSDITRGSNDTPDTIATFNPYDGEIGSTVAAGLVTPGRFSILSAPTGGDRVKVNQFPLFAEGATNYSSPTAPADLGQPTLVNEFDAFADYEGPIALATGWAAANQGGMESIVVGQNSGKGLVRLLAWASNLDGQSKMYVENTHHQGHASFSPTLTFDPPGTTTSVAATSTTAGANLLLSSRANGRFVVGEYNLKRSSTDPKQLEALLTRPILNSKQQASVAGD